VTERLVWPPEVAERLATSLQKDWAAAVCAETQGVDLAATTVWLRPNVKAGAAAARFGFDVWHEWVETWRDVDAMGLPGVEVEMTRMSVEDVPHDIPFALRVAGPDAGLTLLGRLGGALPPFDLGRARRVAGELYAAGALLSPGTLKRVYKLPDSDVRVLVLAVGWLRDHPDLGAWTARQLPIPRVHSKWLEQNGPLLRVVSGRDVYAEVRPRPAVVHLTYVDPKYLATGGRRHDAWTTGDAHDLAYVPRTVLVVENRDSRLWFPPVASTLVVEGGGKAAASLLADVSWIRQAETVVYWGDIDADGFAILDQFRRALAAPGEDGTPGRTVTSILMDGPTAQRYASLGVSNDKNGQPIPASSARLGGLDPHETAAYHGIATAGPAEFRRIEQERIPGEHAKAALLALLQA
jgi:hypothetical protein